MNLAIEALSLPEFRALREPQKIKWHVYTLRLVEKVAEAGWMARREVEKELADRKSDFQSSSRKVDFPSFDQQQLMHQRVVVWGSVSESEFEPLFKRLKRLEERKKGAASRPRTGRRKSAKR
ncbi:MAG: hypothetical protein HC855_06670 [Rhizobiales bacterium]|nr:hypothetical protein [Hyphomicrobiales bacterium]